MRVMYEPLPFKMLRLSDGTHSAQFGPWTLRSAYQPIFDLSSGKAVIAGFEALVRPFIAGRASTPAILFGNTYGHNNQQALETLTRELHIENAGMLPVRGAMLFINLDPSAIADRFEVGSAISAITASTPAPHGQRGNRVAAHPISKMNAGKAIN